MTLQFNNETGMVTVSLGNSRPEPQFLRRSPKQEVTARAPSTPTAKSNMPQEYGQCCDIVAAVSICPAPDCNCLVVEYRGADGLGLQRSEDWEFTCSRCGMQFSVAQHELIFRSVPRQFSAHAPARVGHGDVSSNARPSLAR
jgi:hypothetical protein